MSADAAGNRHTVLRNADSPAQHGVGDGLRVLTLRKVTPLGNTILLRKVMPLGNAILSPAVETMLTT